MAVMQILGALVLLFCSSCLANFTANLKTTWKMTDMNFTVFAGVLNASISNGEVVSGFMCQQKCIFGVFVSSQPVTDSFFGNQVQMIWSANRNRLVGRNSTLELNGEGNLALHDGDGTLVWSTGTSNRSVASMKMDSSGNLILLSSRNFKIWQSFDHPTDVLMPGQVLRIGVPLIASQSGNYSEGIFVMALQPQYGLVLSANASPPQPYWISSMDMSNESYAEYGNNSLKLFRTNQQLNQEVFVSDSQSLHFLRIEGDGNVCVRALVRNSWIVVYELFEELDPFIPPTVCGAYGIFLDGQCSCPSLLSAPGYQIGDSFIALQDKKPQFGCVRSAPLTFNSTGDHHMVEINRTSYFAANIFDGAFVTSMEECKGRCLKDAACEAAFYKRSIVYENFTCSLFSRIYTLNGLQQADQTVRVAFIKMQNWIHPAEHRYRQKTVLSVRIIIVTCIVPGLVAVFVVIVCIIRRRRKVLQRVSDALHSLPGLPMQFTYRDLQSFTNCFSKKLGAGGFGSVFLAELPDGTFAAVKRLEGAKQGQQQFEAEVCTIGNIHHYNLVRLRGFCAEGEHRLLVYEFMPNGSLDKWLLGGQNAQLDWGKRFDICLGIADGLAYLHHECRERILHLDIKPGNILLDEHFTVKISDFGLSKLMNRDESAIMTTMRGTPGYLAPEWLGSKITEKADVYSFGILLLEIICGRRCIDHGETSEKTYLPGWVNKQACDGNLDQVVDSRLEGNINCQEAQRIVHIALRCIQEDASRRPSMRSVSEMLRGISDVSIGPILHSNKLARLFYAATNSSSVNL